MENIDYEQNMQYIAKMYKKLKKELEEKSGFHKKSIYIDTNEEYVRYIDTILSLMPVEYERIIRNDYLQTRTVKWWQEYYKKSTYYRRKRDAVEAFVDCLSL